MKVPMGGGRVVIHRGGVVEGGMSKGKETPERRFLGKTKRVPGKKV